jgi:hypothetical protein
MHACIVNARFRPIKLLEPHSSKTETNLKQLLNRAFQSYQYTHQLKFLEEILEIRSFSLLMGSENQFSVKLFTIFKHEKNVSKFFIHHGSPLAGSTQKSTQKAQKMDSSQGQQKGGA